MRCSLGLAVLLSVALAAPAQTQPTTWVYFDDIVLPPGTQAPITNPYHGLVWDNFFILNPVETPPNGGVFCLVGTCTNAAVNGGGEPASIRAVGDIPFYFLGASFHSGLYFTTVSVGFEGFLGGQEVHS